MATCKLYGKDDYYDQQAFLNSIGVNKATVRYLCSVESGLGDKWDAVDVKMSVQFYVNGILTSVEQNSDGSGHISGQYTAYNNSSSDETDKAKMVISITMKAWYKKDYGQGGKSDEIEVNLSDSIIIYTHPGPFSMNAKKEQSISEILSADNINNNWFPHFNKIYRWYNQENIEYPINLTVNKNDPITAKWFNKCIDAINSVREEWYHKPYVKQNDLITAEIINWLNFNGP